MSIIKFYEKDRFKVALKAERRDLFTVLVLDGENSQAISGRDMDYDTANEVYDFVIDNHTENVLNNLNIEDESEWD